MLVEDATSECESPGEAIAAAMKLVKDWARELDPDGVHDHGSLEARTEKIITAAGDLPWRNEYVTISWPGSTGHGGFRIYAPYESFDEP